jgi:hypothetical protein
MEKVVSILQDQQELIYDCGNREIIKQFNHNHEEFKKTVK